MVNASSPAPTAGNQAPVWNALAGKWQWDDGPHSASEARAIAVTNLFTDPRATTAAHFAAAAPSGSVSQTPTQRADGYQQLASPKTCQEIIATPANGSYVALQTTTALGAMRVGQMCAGRMAAKITNVAGASPSNPWHVALVIVRYGVGPTVRDTVIVWTSPSQTTTDSAALSAALGGSNGWFVVEGFDNQSTANDCFYYELELRVYNDAGTAGAVTLRGTEIVQATDPDGDIPYYVGGDLSQAQAWNGAAGEWLGTTDASQSVGLFDPTLIYPASEVGFNGYGVYDNYVSSANAVKLHREFGCTISRAPAQLSGGQASGPYIAPTLTAGQLANLKALAAAGVKLILQTSPPSWMQSAGYGWPQDDTAGMQTNFANAVVAMIAQIGAGNVYGVQAYNEPNLANTGGASGALDPASYSAFLSKMYLAVHAAYPSVKVFGGTTASDASPAGGTDAVSWLSAMYSAGAQYDVVDIHAYPPSGALSLAGAIYYAGSSAHGVNPYTNNNSSRGTDALIKAIKDVMAANADTRKLFISETGEQAQNERVQGQVVALTLGRVKRDPQILGVIFNTLVDQASAASPPSDWGAVEPTTLRRRYAARQLARIQGMPESPFRSQIQAGDLAQGTYDAAMPWTISLNPVLAQQDAALKVGTWTAFVATAQLGNGAIYNSSETQNDELGFDLSLSAGFWTLAFLCRASTNCAIATINLDGLAVGTVDTYAASLAENTFKSVANIPVTTSGKHRISFKAATKNGSSTSWRIVLQLIQLRRTA